MPKTVEFQDKEYLEIKVQAIAEYGSGYDFDVYLRLSSGKMIKIGNKKENKEEAILRFQNKNVKFVYLLEEDYKFFVNSVKVELLNQIQKFQDLGEDVDQDRIKEMEAERLQKLQTGHTVLKTLFNSGVVDEESQDIARAITVGTMAVISKTGGKKLFKEFRENCSGEYMRAVITSYIVCCMIDKFSWESDQIKEKMVLAALLCDITLKQEDFTVLDKHYESRNNEDLPNNIFKHPLDAAQLLGKTTRFISKETLIVIEEHHERPSGKGFPRGLEHNKINLLSAIYIVAYDFTSRMYNEDFTEEQKDDRMENIINNMTEMYFQGNYKKAMTSILEVMITS
jgi:response regulator RpfG family c-di-GMP phosphodiesterase